MCQGNADARTSFDARESNLRMDDDRTIEEFLSPAYWRAVCPWLHINDFDYFSSTSRSKPVRLETHELGECGRLLRTRGYFQLQRARLGKDVNAVDWGADLNAVAAGVERLMELGYPPLWIMVYDEVWSLAHQLSEIISATTDGRNVNNFDVLAWHVDPAKNQKGFSPHRDRMPATPDLVKASFHDDGTPKYISTWFPLTDATTSNSCLYMLPAEYDPGYATGDDPESNPLHVAMEKDPTAYQHIRALPSSSGSPLLFSHRIIHWGAATDPSPDSLDAEGNQKVTSRIAIGFAFSSNDYEPPYLDPDTHLPFPAIELRVALAAAQGITYYKRLGFNRHQLALFNRIFVSKQSEFGERYVKKIRGEYQWAQFAMKRQG